MCGSPRDSTTASVGRFPRHRRTDRGENASRGENTATGLPSLWLPSVAIRRESQRQPEVTEYRPSGRAAARSRVFRLVLGPPQRRRSPPWDEGGREPWNGYLRASETGPAATTAGRPRAWRRVGSSPCYACRPVGEAKRGASSRSVEDVRPQGVSVPFGGGAFVRHRVPHDRARRDGGAPPAAGTTLGRWGSESCRPGGTPQAGRRRAQSPRRAFRRGA